MRKFLALVLSYLIIMPAMANTSVSPTEAPTSATPTPPAAQPAVVEPAKKLALRVDLNFQQPDEGGAFEVCMVKNTIKTLSNNHDWIKIQDQDNDNSEYYILLGKIESATDKDVTVKFLLLNTSTTPTILSTPKLILRYGEKGRITIADKKDKMELNVLATML